MADTSTPSSLLGSELAELLRTTPPLATRRQHDLPDNQTWFGRAASIVERWDSSRSAAFVELNRQFHGRNAHETSAAFEQRVVLLRQAEHDLILLRYVLWTTRDPCFGAAISANSGPGIEVVGDSSREYVIPEPPSPGERRGSNESARLISVVSNTLKPGEEKIIAQRLKEILKPASDRARGA